MRFFYIILFILNFLVLQANTKKEIYKFSIKASCSIYNTYFPDYFDIPVLDITILDFEINPNFNLHFEWLIKDKYELSFYGGIYKYPMIYDIVNYKFDHFIAPTFGFNVNYYIKKIYSKKEFERGGIYIAAQLGGVYLTKWNSGKYNILPMSHFFAKSNINKLRLEYGFGFGANYFFTKHIGVNFELLLGQFSYFPDIFSKNFNSSFGIKCKI